MEGREGALQTAGSWSRRDTFGLTTRLDSGKVGAACVWRTPSEWTGRRYHLGNNKDVFDAGVYAVFQALSIIDQGKGGGHRYTVFVGSTLAIGRAESTRQGATGVGGAGEGSR